MIEDIIEKTSPTIETVNPAALDDSLYSLTPITIPIIDIMCPTIANNQANTMPIIPNINETFAFGVLEDNGNDWTVEEANSYYFTEAYEAISRILSVLCDQIILIQEKPDITSDVSSELDNYLREFTKDVNYFINKKLG